MQVSFSEPEFKVVAATRALNRREFLPEGSALYGFYEENLEVGPELLTALSAAGTHTSSSIFEIMKNKLVRFEADIQRSSSPESRKSVLENNTKSYISKVFDNTLGRGHIDVADMSTYLVSGLNVPRIVSLFLCSPHHLSHEQQSLRYTMPRGFFLSSQLQNSNLGPKAKKLTEDAFNLYLKMVETGIPLEDARSLFPLSVNSNITTTGNGREFTYLIRLARNENLALPQIISQCIDQIDVGLREVAGEVFKDRGPNYDLRRYYPSPQLFSTSNEYVNEIIKEHAGQKVVLLGFSKPWDLGDRKHFSKSFSRDDPAFYNNLLHVRATFLVKLSLEAAHQAVRHRTWNHDFESLYRASERREYMIPPSIKTSPHLEEYIHIIESFYDMYSLVKDEFSQPEALIFLPNAHYIYDVVELDGWNIVGNLPLRTCEKAQWEIREVAKQMVSRLAWGSEKLGFRGDKTLSFYALPTCQTFNVCYEDNSKELCPIYAHKFLRSSKNNGVKT